MQLPRPSSAVVLTRGDGRDLEAYLVQRSPALRFLGGYWAFPGGVVDRMDFDSAGEEDEHTSVRCAIREMFEETNVLPAALDAKLAGQERASLRADLLAHRAFVPRWCELLAANPRALDEAVRYGRMTTPPFSRLRYRTEFHHLVLSGDQEPDFAEGELVAGRFWRPEDVLAAWTRGEIDVSPPMVMQLGLHGGGSAAAWFAACAEECARLEAGRLECVRQTPGILTLPLLTPTQPPGISTCCYLVGTERVFVVDPAPVDEKERARFFEVIDEWRDAGRHFAGILLTHHHHDHVGAARVMAERYGLAVYAHPWTLEHLSFTPSDARELHDGDELDLGTAPDGTTGWKLRALHTPGHAPGHLVFLESRYRSAIVGDMLATGSTIVIDPPEGHLATYLASLERLAAAGIKTVHPAHGLQFRDGPRLVRDYLAHRREREEKLDAALAPAPRGLDALLEEVYDDTPPELHHLARRSLLAGLIKLGEEGRAVETADGWAVPESLPPPPPPTRG